LGKQVPKSDEAASTVDAAGRCCGQLSNAFNVFEHISPWLNTIKHDIKYESI